MRIRTDDDVYRVDAVWLGPPKATFPWRARYVAWGVGVPVFLLVLTVERQMGFSFGFFSTAWAFVITIVITRFITAKISHERPLGSVMTMWARELRTPRERSGGTGGAVSASKVRVRTERPRPKSRTRGPRTRGASPHPATQHSTARARRGRSPAPVGR
ncbi:hypothetical protein [Amycolatopsis palatopharyngis]|uniref:hypothetical protein n=1 Tax=Amycolatopsis palatopharyngis TaxID=187982 RepID=UPI000E221E7C|nr:hypothetical protein [Amycolatopsis palatopharyngis]